MEDLESKYDKLETRHIELQLKFQQLEQLLWTVIALLAGVMIYFNWAGFPVAVPVSLAIGFGGYFLIAERPFTKEFSDV